VCAEPMAALPPYAFALIKDRGGADVHQLLGPPAMHEFRHESWFDDEVARRLQKHRIAVCQSDAADRPLWDAVTTDLVYVQLHGHAVTHAAGYSDAELRRWARHVRRWQREGREVHVYLENDGLGHAPRNALRLIELVDRR